MASEIQAENTGNATPTVEEWETLKQQVSEIHSIMGEVRTVVKQGQSVLENGGIAGLLSGGAPGGANPMGMIMGSLLKRR